MAAIKPAIAADELNTRLGALLGYGWRSAFSRYLGVANSTVSDWSNGRAPVPAYVLAVVELLEQLKAGGLPLPDRLTIRPLKSDDANA